MKIWLTANRIYFETIAATLVGVASVLLSVASIKIAYDTNRLTSAQLQMAKVEHLPVLNFDLNLQRDPTTNNYAYEQLTITNIGAPLGEFTNEEATFFKTEYIVLSPFKRDVALVPINAYYGTGFETQNKTGELAKWVNFSTPGGNHNKASQVIKDSAELARSQSAIA